MINLLELAGSTLLAIAIVAGLTVVFMPRPRPRPIDYGTPEERHARRLATYRIKP